MCLILSSEHINKYQLIRLASCSLGKHRDFPFDIMRYDTQKFQQGKAQKSQVQGRSSGGQGKTANGSVRKLGLKVVWREGGFCQMKTVLYSLICLEQVLTIFLESEKWKNTCSRKWNYLRVPSSNESVPTSSYVNCFFAVNLVCCFYINICL